MKIDDHVLIMMMRNAKLHDIDHAVCMQRYLNVLLKGLGSRFSFMLWQTDQFHARLNVDRTQVELARCKRYYEKSYNQP